MGLRMLRPACAAQKEIRLLELVTRATQCKPLQIKGELKITHHKQTTFT